MMGKREAQSIVKNSLRMSFLRTSRYIAVYMHGLRGLTRALQGDFGQILEKPLDVLTKALNVVEKPSGNKNDTVQGLRRVLLSWKSASDGPKKLVYLLSMHYEDLAAAHDALEPIDKKKTALIASLAKKYGFRVGLSTVEYYEQGYGVSSDRYGRYGRFGGYKRNKWRNRYRFDRCYYGGGGGCFDESEEEEESEDEEIEMVEVEETDFRLQNLIDLDGETLKKGVVHFDDESEAVQSDITDTLTSQGHDKQAYRAVGKSSDVVPHLPFELIISCRL